MNAQQTQSEPLLSGDLFAIPSPSGKYYSIQRNGQEVATLIRSETAPFPWHLRAAGGQLIDWDQYQNDIRARHGIKRPSANKTDQTAGENPA